MKLILLFLAAILLTACTAAPAADLPAPTYGMVANATLLVGQATQIAGTLQANESTRAVQAAIEAQATADYFSTQQQMANVQTQAVMTERAAVSTSEAIAEVAKSTESAQKTATVEARIAISQETAIAATGTALYWDSQVTDAEAQRDIVIARSDAKRTQNINDAVSGGVNTATIIIVGIAILTAIVCSSILTYFTFRHLEKKQKVDSDNYERRKQAELEAHQAEQDAKVEEARQRAFGIWLENWQKSQVEIRGTKYQITTRGLLPLLPEPGTVSRDLQEIADWKRALTMLCQNGIQMLELGQEEQPFSEPTLTVRQNIVFHRETGRPWLEGARTLLDLGKAMGVFGLVKQGGKTWFADGVTVSSYVREIDSRPLPYIPKGNVPGIRIPSTLRSSEVSEVYPPAEEIIEVEKLLR